jgi:glycosyltransferase involved in cell wall biosynthesis
MADGVRAAGTPASKVVVAPNSCDMELFDVPEASGIRYRQEQGWLGSRHLVAYCGALGELNDVSYLVRLAACMEDRDANIVFGIYGTGKEETKVRDLAKEMGVLGVNFFMLGEIPKNQIPTVLNAASAVASVFCPIPQMRVNSANKFFDGLAAARPIVINYEGWQADLLRSTGAGIVLDAMNVDRSADELAAYLADSRRLKSAGTAARQLAGDQFSRDRIARIVLDAVEEAAASV